MSPMISVAVKSYPDYGSTDVEWLGEIPAHWEVRRIKSLAGPDRKSFVDGDWIELPFITSDGIRLIQTGNIGVGEYREKGYRYINEETFRAFNCTEFRPGDVLICRLGEPVARACLAPELGKRMITSVDVCILKPSNDIISKFVVYAMSSPDYLNWVGSLVRGSTRDRVSRSMLGKFYMPVPPPLEQDAIVRYLDHANSRIQRYISAKERFIELLTEQKQAIINQAVTRGLDPKVPLKPSGVEWLGDVPAHWDVKRAKYFYHEVDERSISGVEQLMSVSHKTGVTPRKKNVTMFLAESNVGYKMCRAGDIAINTMWAYMAALGVARQIGIVSPSYGVYRPSVSHTFNLDYVDSLLRTESYRSEYLCRSTGITSSRLRLYPDSFLAIPLVCPPLAEQTAIVEYLDKATADIDITIDHARRQIELMQEYRTRLIADVVTGKIDVRGAVADEVEVSIP